MTSATPQPRSFFERTTHAFGVLHDVGLLSPRFLVSMLRGAREAGASTALGVVAGRHHRGDAASIIDDAGTTSFADLHTRTLSIANALS